mmetsp:Transcript_4656/g.6590  ORF Transcript_4656/g.6590 Transcript_4656/m.6590 type:complete len:370 (-) Transcript_4656:54-1163(-)
MSESHWTEHPAAQISTLTAICLSSLFFLFPHISKLLEDLRTPTGPNFSERSRSRIVFLRASIVAYNFYNFLICIAAGINRTIVRKNLHSDESICKQWSQFKYFFYFFSNGLMWHTLCAKLRVMDNNDTNRLFILIMNIASWAFVALLFTLLFIPDAFSTTIAEEKCTAIMHWGMNISLTLINLIFSVAFLWMFTLPLFRTQDSKNVSRYRRTAWVNITCVTIAFGSSCALSILMVYLYWKKHGQQNTWTRLFGVIDTLINLICLNLTFNPLIYKKFYRDVATCTCLKSSACSRSKSIDDDETGSRALSAILKIERKENRIRPWTKAKPLIPERVEGKTKSINGSMKQKGEHSTLDSAILSMLKKPVNVD